ncbi:putative Metallo-hydrolase/oxidoreductase, Beta-lactamase-like protein [Pseudoloma neurophilia]|uniref:Putative Metallo-hydrolase/oxidoreductase, Beta-lactamase-like protein n=1 Tax=Pseudoloma neurophilia TaxID=146866 RepID=A0A0R0M767_9MICR|nr:putative Metallo-hydrolase/oxidoreductase, Beta-lactamase-like protein [Pseudoloma neurophilia]
MPIKIRIMGSGPSSGVPSIKCRLSGGCQVCKTVRRTNVSILITKYHLTDSGSQEIIGSVLIDCGKHFFDQFNEYLNIVDVDFKKDRLVNPIETKKNVNLLLNIENLSNQTLEKSEIVQENIKDSDQRRVDLIPDLILTHPHADAISGIDTYLMMNNGAMPLFCDKFTFTLLKESFKYFFREPSLKRVRSFFTEEKSTILKDNLTFKAGNMTFKSFEMLHGRCTAMAFLIEGKALYISDCSEITENQLEYFRKLSLKFLFIDCLALSGYNIGHLNLEDVKKYVARIKPEHVILVGCSHEIPNVKKLDDFFVSYDGMEIDIE